MNPRENYKIIQMIAKGGTAILYKAIQTSLDRTVAVKKLHQHLTDDENFTRRFILEAKAAASLNHENIVRVIDFGMDEGEYQIIMEFVEGRSLKDIIKEKGRFPQDIALAITHQICLGLDHAHSKGIIHRDIKPGNIMITYYGRVKITDFGLAKLTQGASYQTIAESILGTPLYMSPEQAYGETVDLRSDIFSLGTVLYEMLTGKQPFFSNSCAAIINNIINCDIKPPSLFNEEIPEELDDLILTALSKSREARFQSANEFRKAIEGYLGVVKLKEASEKLSSYIYRSDQTLVLSDTPTPSSKIRRKKRIRAALSSGLIAATAAAIAFHSNMILDFFKKGLGTPPPAEHKMAKMQGGFFNEKENFSVIVSYLQARDSVFYSSYDSTNTSPQALPAPAVEAIESTSLVDSTEVASAKAKEGENRETRTGNAEPTEKKKIQEKKVKRIKKGWLSISADPVAEIYIDGKYIGDAPTRDPISLQAGLHTLECRNPQYETYRENLHITPGELSRRTVMLEKLKGTIEIFSQPGAEFYLDGIFKGIIPLNKQIEVEIGKHVLTLKKPGFNTWSSEIKIEANQKLPLRITLTPSFQR